MTPPGGRDRTVPLELRKRALFSREYVAEEGRAVVAELRCSCWRPEATLRVDGTSLELRRRGVLRHGYSLSLVGSPVGSLVGSPVTTTLVEVTQPSAWRSALVFAFDGVEYRMRRETWFGSTLVVESRGRTIGRIRRRGPLSRGAIVELPDRLPVAVRVFLGWVAMIGWREAAAVGAAGAGTAA